MKSCPNTSNIPPLVSLANIAAYAVPKVMVGRILSPGLSPQPYTGTLSIQIPKINTRTGPRMIEGIQIPNKEIDIGTTSKSLPGFKEATNPELIPKNNANNIEYKASSTVVGSPDNINSFTVRPGYLNEGPKSPTAIFLMYEITC